MLKKTALATFVVTSMFALTANAQTGQAQTFKSELGPVTATPVVQGLDHP